MTDVRTTEPAQDADATLLSDRQHDETSEPFVGKWTQLVSQTNWDKGRIICEWRDTLVGEGADVSAYSDEAWSRRVGGVSPQHVGRLRRVWQRFGDDRESYAGVYWSHFLAALDWTDAEMWLEGTVQNGWSVSQMRGKRWESLGGPEELKPRDEDIITEEFAVGPPPATSQGESPSAVVDAGHDVAAADRNTIRESEEPTPSDREHDGEPEDAPPGPTPLADLPALPDELAEAFEQFKLAILNQKVREWPDTTAEEVIACLDALKELSVS